MTAGQPLSAALAAGGKLRLKNGSFDARGYRMTFARDGSPRFVKAAVAAVASDVSWSDRFGDVGQPQEANGLLAVAVSGADVYVGGTFTALNRYTPLVSANHVAHWNGRGWSALGTPSANGVNGQVRAIAVSGASVYVGGDFSSAGGVAASHVAKWNGSSWSALGSGVTNVPGTGTNNSGLTVRALTVSGSILYVGGTFDKAGSVTANSIAAWNGTTWSALGGGMLSCNCTPVWAGRINALLVSGSTLYAGGAFVKAGSVATSGIARWNGTSWSALGGNGAQGQFIAGAVNAFALLGTTVYAGGSFASMSGVSAANVASWDGTSWHPLGTGIAGTTPTTVQALAVFAGKLFAGGTFSDAGGDGQPAIAQWNGAAWSAVGAGLAGAVNALAVSPSGVAVGGLFGGSGGTTLHNIGTWTGAAWTGFGLGISGGGDLTALAASGRDLYAGGVFSAAGPTATSNMAHFNGSRWDAMGGGFPGGEPFAVAIDGSQVYVGGHFSQAGTVAALNIAMWDGSAWHALGSGTDGWVKALLVYQGKLWAGGTFAHAGSIPANNVATWNPSTHVWAPVGKNLGYDGASPSVTALTGIRSPANPASNHFVMIGGGFSSITDGTTHVTVNSVLMFDTTALITAPFSGYYKFNGTAAGSVGVTTNCGSGCPGTVSALYADGLKVYVGGAFDVAGSVASRGFALLDIGAAPGNGWSSPGTVGGSLPGTVQAITKVGASLYLAGDFSIAGTVSAADVAQYTPATHTWAALGSGLGEPSNTYDSDGVNALASSTDGLYVGGGFSTAGAKPSPNLALWTATAAAPTLTSFTPTSGKAGVTQVSITGNSFWGATAVRFNGQSASFKILSGTQITAVVAIAATSGKLTVTTPRGTATSALSFTVTP